MAGDLLTKHDTSWQLWNDKLNKKQRRGGHAYQELHAEEQDRKEAQEEDSHVGHVLGHMREGGKKFISTPRLRRGQEANSCRIFGSLEGNKVQGDFHITARGHGYFQFGDHLDHSSTSLLLEAILDTDSCRIQFLPPHHRALFRAPLSLPAQSSRQDAFDHCGQLLQIPILSVYRANNLHTIG